MPSIVSHLYHFYPIILCNSRSYTLLYIYFLSSTDTNITIPVMVIFGQNERESIINYLSLKKYKLLWIPKIKMTDNNHDRSFTLPFQKGKSLFSMTGRMKRLLRPKFAINKDQNLLSFKRLKLRFTNRQFDTQNTLKPTKNRPIHARMSENHISAHYSLLWQEKAE